MLWFVSSENYLVFSGRDKQQNEFIFSKYLNSQDVLVCSDIQDSGSVFIKNINAAVDGGHFVSKFKRKYNEIESKNLSKDANTKILGTFFETLRNFPKASERIRTRPDASECIRTYPNRSKQVPTRLKILENSRTHRKTSRTRRSCSRNLWNFFRHQ